MIVRIMLKVCSLAALALLVFFALGPAKWTPRSGLGFQFDHFVGYFFFTLLVCLAWPRPLVVGGALTVLAIAVENLQSFLPGRSSYFVAALYSAAGVLAAAPRFSFEHDGFNQRAPKENRDHYSRSSLIARMSPGDGQRPRCSAVTRLGASSPTSPNCQSWCDARRSRLPEEVSGPLRKTNGRGPRGPIPGV
jgi:hypothetical protein